MIYIYRCSKCNSQVEIELPISQCHELQFCDSCNCVLQKVITECNFILKGKGWGKDATS